MKNIQNLYVNLPSRLIIENWDILYEKYQKIENRISTNNKNNLLFKKIIHNTGAFVIERKKLENSEDSFAMYFKTNPNRIIKLKSKILLRGRYYFPGIDNSLGICDRLKIINSEILSIKSTLIETSIDSNIILFLGLIDNLKNYYLILFNILNNYEIHLKKETKTVLYSNLSFAINTLEYFEFATLDRGEIIFEKEILYVRFEGKLIDVLMNKFIASNIDPTRVFRKIRESNDPSKLFKFGKEVAEEFIPRNTLAIGFSYGGIELPFCINAQRILNGKAPLPMLILNLSSYSLETANRVQDISDTMPIGIPKDILKLYENILLLDDSVTTGRTIQKFLNTVENSFRNIFLGIVAFRVTNRYHHLVRPLHGGINPQVADFAVISSIGDYAKTYKKFCYTNANGIFDKNKARIYKLLDVSP